MGKNGAMQQQVRLNVGGYIFTSCRETFLRWEGTYFHALLSGCHWNPDEDGMYSIDRDPRHFDRIMESLRTGLAVDFDGLCARGREQLQVEVDYYHMFSMVRWDVDRCDPGLLVTNGRRTITQMCVKRRDAALAQIPNVSSFTIRIQGSPNGCFVGYMHESSFRAEARSVSRNSGWFLHCGDSTLHHAGQVQLYNCELAIVQGDAITVHFSKAVGTISFEVNHKSCGVAYHDVDCNGDFLYPCVKLCSRDVSVFLEDNW